MFKLLNVFVAIFGQSLYLLYLFEYSLKFSSPIFVHPVYVNARILTWIVTVRVRDVDHFALSHNF